MTGDIVEKLEVMDVIIYTHLPILSRIYILILTLQGVCSYSDINYTNSPLSKSCSHQISL